MIEVVSGQACQKRGVVIISGKVVHGLTMGTSLGKEKSDGPGENGIFWGMESSVKLKTRFKT